MHKLLGRLLAVLATTLLLSGALVPSASAVTATCNSRLGGNCSAGTVSVTVTVGGSSSNTITTTGTITCTFNGQPLPCDSALGYWSGQRGCYVSRANPQPPLTDPIWGTNTTGVIYDCHLPANIGGSRHAWQFWAATPPLTTSQVADLISQATAQLGITAINLGMAPEPRPGRVGIVGLPVWMWVASPDAHTYGPASRTVSRSGVSVTVRASVEKVTWDMGDGGTVVCGKGTPYQVAYGVVTSPNCGYKYTHTGTYTVRASSHWIITYTSTVGISGQLTMTLDRTGTVVIGEAQVLAG